MTDDRRPSELEEPGAGGARAPRPLLTLRDGLPPITDTEAGLAEACAAIAAGTGPVAIDAERASGYRYSSRAYLIQLRREGSGTWLVDPIAFESLAPLAEALEGTEWILHAATQDLPCLAEVGLRPGSLFDTELAGRLLGYPRVGLATLVETVLGRRMKKEHSAVDWSRRPLPEPWLEYAALDVEVLVELRDALADQLVEAGKDEWARQEFEAPALLRGHRRGSTRGVVRRGCTGSAAAAASARCGRCGRPATSSPSAATSPRAGSSPTPRSSPPPRPCPRTATRCWRSRGSTAAAPSATPPAGSPRSGRSPRSTRPTCRPARRAPTARRSPAPGPTATRSPPAGSAWPARRSTELAEQQGLPVENLLTPDYLRRVLWTPPATRDPKPLAAAVAAALSELGARPGRSSSPARSSPTRSWRPTSHRRWPSPPRPQSPTEPPETTD